MLSTVAYAVIWSNMLQHVTPFCAQGSSHFAAAEWVKLKTCSWQPGAAGADMRTVLQQVCTADRRLAQKTAGCRCHQQLLSSAAGGWERVQHTVAPARPLCGMPPPPPPPAAAAPMQCPAGTTLRPHPLLSNNSPYCGAVPQAQPNGTPVLLSEPRDAIKLQLTVSEQKK